MSRESEARDLLARVARDHRPAAPSMSYRIDVNSLAKEPFSGSVQMNDIFHAALLVQQPVFMDAYATDRATGAFVLIDEATNQTVAAGMIE